MSTALATVVQGPGIVRAEDATRTFEPRSLDEAYQTAARLVKSGLLPRAVSTPEAALLIIMTGRELGLTAMQSLRSIHVIEGKTSLSADLICAQVKRSDLCEYFRLVESSDKIATYETKRRGEPGSTTMSFSIEDAQRANLTGKDNWRKYPAAMLRARAITALSRAVYPDVAMGLYDPDEIGDAPASPPPRYEVVKPAAETVNAEPPPRRDPTQVFAMMRSRIDAAMQPSQLNDVARMSMSAYRAGDLTDEQLDEIKDAVAARREALARTEPPPAAASEPRQREPGDDAEEES